MLTALFSNLTDAKSSSTSHDSSKQIPTPISDQYATKAEGNTKEAQTAGGVGTGRNLTTKQALGSLDRSATIRSVQSADGGSESSPESKQSQLASSYDSTASAASATMAASQIDTASPSPKVRLKSPSNADPPTLSNGGGGVRVIETHDVSLLSEGGEENSGQWDSTIGKAGLGKTGRVINKLVSDNDALKRDLKIEKLKADEAKQAQKLMEDRMERMVSDYESRLLEANVTKTLLARKERQVESLTETVEIEKNKSRVAWEKEKTWRDELEKTKIESKAQVDEATNFAKLMEGRYNTISSHWNEQGQEVKRSLSKMKVEVADIAEERRNDDKKIQSLHELCDQQDGNIQQLMKDKEKITRKFEEYKRLQEQELKDLKTKGFERDAEQERLLTESKAALDKLRWALNVKQNVKGAQ